MFLRLIPYAAAGGLMAWTTAEGGWVAGACWIVVGVAVWGMGKGRKG